MSRCRTDRPGHRARPRTPRRPRRRPQRPRCRRPHLRAPGSRGAYVTSYVSESASRTVRISTPSSDVGMVDQHVDRKRVATEHRVRRVGSRSDDGERRAGGEREAAVVGEQHHDRAREVERQCARLRVVEVDLAHLDRGPVRVEQPELTLLPQHPHERTVDGLLVDQPRGDRVQQRRAERVRRGKLDVDARLERQGRGLAEALGDADAGSAGTPPRSSRRRPSR